MPPPSHKDIQEALTAGKFDAALAGIGALLGEDAEDQEALYMQAVCLRYLRRFEEAFEPLNALKRLSPEHGRTHQEEGHLLRDSGNFPAAAIAYRRACRYNPALIGAWNSLAAVLEKQAEKSAGKNAGNSPAKQGAAQEAAAARRQVARLQNLPKPVLAAADLIAQGRWVKAEEILRPFLRKFPKHVEAMRLLADIGVKLGVLDDAEYLLESACEFEPDNFQVRIDYVQVLRKRQKYAAAHAAAKALLERAPDNLQFQSLYAVECMHIGDVEQALARFDQVLAALPADPVTRTSRGHACKTMGDFDAAVADYRKALAAQPAHGEAYYSLANLKTYQFRKEEIAAMREQTGNANLSHLDRVYLAFALGKACEDRGEYEESFRHYAEGNALKKQQSRYTGEKIRGEFDAQMEVCGAEFFAERQGWGCGAPDPIFIVGLPRAGSTLLEQILSSHSMVDGTLELPNVLSLTHRLRRGKQITAESKYPAVLRELSADEFKEFGEAYIRDTRIHRQAAPFFIDKMPNNFRHLSLIRLMLPNAKIIDARRQPMACCFSCFRQLFAEGQEFSYSLADLGAYYRDYERLMAHWNRLLPDWILTVRHEEVVEDLEGQVRRILDFCGLPFEQACVDYHQTRRNIRTPSSEQVRQPIFRSGLDSWENYAPWLGPLKEALGVDAA